MRPKDNKKYLVFEFEGYSFYKLPVNDETSEIVNYLRGLHKERLFNAGYDGYSEEIDNEFHINGIYFYAEYEDVIATTLRINDRMRPERFPFEMGYKKDESQYTYDNNIQAVDMNTYCLDRRYYKKATPSLFAMAGKHIRQQGAKRAFGLADIRNEAIQHIYSEVGIEHSKEFSEPVSFKTFVHKEDGKPVEWLILEWSEQEINKYSEIFDQKYHK